MRNERVIVQRVNGAIKTWGQIVQKRGDRFVLLGRRRISNKPIRRNLGGCTNAHEVFHLDRHEMLVGNLDLIAFARQLGVWQ